MEKKKDTKKTTNESELYSRLKEHLYCKQPLLGEDSPFSELLQQMVNKLLDGEMGAFIEGERLQGKKNKRNGRTSKQVLSQTVSLHIDAPSNRNGDFTPELVGKHQRELFSGLDVQILALYAQGNSVEDVRRLLARMYGVHISAGKISQITDKVLPHIQEWWDRPLQAFEPIGYLDAMNSKLRHKGCFDNRAFCTVYSVDWEGQRNLPGTHVQSTEVAHSWDLVLQDLHG